MIVATMILDWMISQGLQQNSVFFAVLVAVMYKNVSGMIFRLTLIILPLSDVSCNKIAVVMRYIVEKIGVIAVQNNIDIPYFLFFDAA